MTLVGPSVLFEVSVGYLARVMLVFVRSANLLCGGWLLVRWTTAVAAPCTKDLSKMIVHV